MYIFYISFPSDRDEYFVTHIFFASPFDRIVEGTDELCVTGIRKHHLRKKGSLSTVGAGQRERVAERRLCERVRKIGAKENRKHVVGTWVRSTHRPNGADEPTKETSSSGIFGRAIVAPVEPSSGPEREHKHVLKFFLFFPDRSPYAICSLSLEVRSMVTLTSTRL